MNRTGDGRHLGQKVVMLVLGALVSRCGLGSIQRILCTYVITNALFALLVSRRDRYSRNGKEDLMVTFDHIIKSRMWPGAIHF